MVRLRFHGNIVVTSNDLLQAPASGILAVQEMAIPVSAIPAIVEAPSDIQ